VISINAPTGVVPILTAENVAASLRRTMKDAARVRLVARARPAAAGSRW
jgi:hypothetical protein